jgi:hypothetical protein
MKKLLPLLVALIILAGCGGKEIKAALDAGENLKVISID